MTQKETKNLLDFVNSLPETEENLTFARIVYKLLAENLALREKQTPSAVTHKKEEKTITFTQKELDLMPEDFKQLFAFNNSVTYRLRNGSYEARYRRGGYSIEVSGKDIETTKKRFIYRLTEIDNRKNRAAFPRFSDYAASWLKVKKRTVKEATYDYYKRQLYSMIIPRFGRMRLNEITRDAIQNFLFEYTDHGKNRTAQKIKQILHAIFALAAEDFGLKSPMGKIVLPHHEPKKGHALSKIEEKQLVEFCAENSHIKGSCGLLALLYTGMRAGELASATFDGTFIYCVSEKIRKGYAEVTRMIPVSPMMKKVLPLIDFDLARKCSNSNLRDALKRVLPARHVHELRYTFITRANDCVQ